MTAGLIVLAVGVWLAWPGSSRRRLPMPPGPTPRPRGPDLAAVVAGVAVAVGLGGGMGVVWGVAVGLAARLLLRRLDATDRSGAEDIARQAPDAVDCLASCLAAGAPLWPAVRSVADAFGDPLRGVWRRCADRHELGAAPADTFAEWLGEPSLAAAGRLLMRSSESGGALTLPLIACARRLREDRAEVLEVRARAVGVKAVAPLGICFLPAFILVAVVPIVGSLVQTLL